MPAKGHADVCELLVRFSADPLRASRSDGSTPLCCAVAHGHLTACQVLLDAKSDVNHRLQPPQPPQESSFGSVSAGGALAQTVLGLAVDSGGNGDIVGLLLNRKAAVDAKDSAGATALCVRGACRPVCACEMLEHA